MLACVPKGLQVWLNETTKARIVLDASGADILLASVNRKNAVTARETIPGARFGREQIDRFRQMEMPGAPVELHLPPGDFYLRELDLPEAARSRIAHVLALDLERRTPFRNTEVWQAHAEKAMVGGKLRVRQIILRHFILNERLATLGLSQKDIAAVRMPSGESGAADYPAILLVAKPVRAGYRANIWLACLMAMALVLGGAILAVRAVRLENALEQVNQQSRKLAGDAKSARKQMAELDALHANISGLREKKVNGFSAVGIIDEITRIVPNSSWLSEIRIDDKTVTISGFSAQATDLIALLDQSALFSQASLVGPVTLDPVEAKERFVISMQLKSQEKAKINADN